MARVNIPPNRLSELTAEIIALIRLGFASRCVPASIVRAVRTVENVNEVRVLVGSTLVGNGGAAGADAAEGVHGAGWPFEEARVQPAIGYVARYAAQQPLR